ncbi:hypothetical protein TIFTF001_040494 [Ficus carica]|uniref:Uncharacterized protein n=1 Tax=Ficus carica TaxID=3494 RepID=A0AA88CNR5_FICCA|nr:hypothetical protein TIFTF001_040494 [Ficus carica]
MKGYIASQHIQRSRPFRRGTIKWRMPRNFSNSHFKSSYNVTARIPKISDTTARICYVATDFDSTAVCLRHSGEDDGRGSGEVAQARTTNLEFVCSDRTIRYGAGDQIRRPCQPEAACEALTRIRLGDGYRQDGGGSCGDPPWKHDRSCEIVRSNHRPSLPRIGRSRDLYRDQLPPLRSPPRCRRGPNLVASSATTAGSCWARDGDEVVAAGLGKGVTAVTGSRGDDSGDGLARECRN